MSAETLTSYHFASYCVTDFLCCLLFLAIFFPWFLIYLFVLLPFNCVMIKFSRYPTEVAFARLLEEDFLFFLLSRDWMWLNSKFEDVRPNCFEIFCFFFIKLPPLWTLKGGGTEIFISFLGEKCYLHNCSTFSCNINNNSMILSALGAASNWPNKDDLIFILIFADLF